MNIRRLMAGLSPQITSSLAGQGRRSVHDAPWKLLQFDSSGFETMDEDEDLDEEAFYDGEKWTYYPVRIGEVLASRYQVAGKLGFGISSTVWLARDIE